MIDETRKQLGYVPFVSLSIRASDGREYSVPTADHAYITPRGNRLILIDDKDTAAILGPLRISGVIRQANGS